MLHWDSAVRLASSECSGPSPEGRVKVKGVAERPTFTYSSKLDYAKDLKLNLSSLASETTLTPQQLAAEERAGETRVVFEEWQHVDAVEHEVVVVAAHLRQPRVPVPDPRADRRGAQDQ